MRPPVLSWHMTLRSRAQCKMSFTARALVPDTWCRREKTLNKQTHATFFQALYSLCTPNHLLQRWKIEHHAYGSYFVFLRGAVGKEIYQWEQSLEEVNVLLRPPDWVKAKNIECKITQTHLTIGVQGNAPFLNVRSWLWLDQCELMLRVPFNYTCRGAHKCTLHWGFCLLHSSHPPPTRTLLCGHILPCTVSLRTHTFKIIVLAWFLSPSSISSFWFRLDAMSFSSPSCDVLRNMSLWGCCLGCCWGPKPKVSFFCAPKRSPPHSRFSRNENFNIPTRIL